MIDPRTPEADTTQLAAARRTTGGSVLRGGMWIVASNLVPQFFTLIVSIAGARYLGPSGLGRQSFIAFSATSATLLLGLGLPIALMRQIGEAVGAGRAAEARGLVRRSWSIAVVGGLAGAGLFIGISLAGAEPRAAWMLAAIICLTGVLNGIPGAVLTGLQQWRTISLIVLGAGVCTTVATVAVLAAGGGVTGMVAVQCASSSAILLAMATFAMRNLVRLAPAPAAPKELLPRMLRFAALTMLGSVLTLIVFRRSEFLILGYYSSDRQIALYSVAFSAASTLVLIPQALGSVASPAFATLVGAGAFDRIRSGFGRTFRLLLLVSLPVTAVGVALGPAVVRLAFGPKFDGTRVPLLIMITTLPLVAVLSLSVALMVGLGKAKFPLIAGAAAAAVDLLLGLTLIPNHAAVGAAIANAAAQGTEALILLVAAVRAIESITWESAVLFRAAAASGAGAAAAWGVLEALGGGGVGAVAAGLVAGTAVFMLLGATLGIVPNTDAVWLDQHAGGMLGGMVGRVSRGMAARGMPEAG